PSHVSPVASVEAGFTDLIDRMRAWVRAYAPGTPLTLDNQPFAVTPHLVASYQTTSCFYAVISDSGKALFVDYGSASHNFIDSSLKALPVHDRLRFIAHTIPALRARYGLKSVDVAMPSHMHDDHLNGFPYLVGTTVQRSGATTTWSTYLKT